MVGGALNVLCGLFCLIVLVGMNCAGLNSKWQSFNKLILDLSPGVFFGQETKLTKKQNFKIQN